RHRAATTRLLREVERGELPPGCGSAILADRDAANTLRRIGFVG
ncbi:ATP-binding protein, partial [Streptomyces violarus]|nr:ATP-binding protein [Streptomyces violarus]